MLTDTTSNLTDATTTLWELGKLENLGKLGKLTGATSVHCEQFHY